MIRTKVTTTLATLAKQANTAHRACQAAVQSALGHARECGMVLLSAKLHLKHGDFENWIITNCTFAPRMARNYMTIAGNWLALVNLSKRQRASDLPQHASDLALDSMSMREALRILSAGGPESGEATFLDDHCPACGERLVVTSRRWATCPSCYDCRLHGLPRGKPPRTFASTENHVQHAITSIGCILDPGDRATAMVRLLDCLDPRTRTKFLAMVGAGEGQN